jgi:hypothetical protein
VPLVIEGRGCALQSIPSWTWLRRLVWLASGGIASRKRRHVDLLALDYRISRSSVFWREKKRGNIYLILILKFNNIKT